MRPEVRSEDPRGDVLLLDGRSHATSSPDRRVPERERLRMRGPGGANSELSILVASLLLSDRCPCWAVGLVMTLAGRAIASSC